MQRHIGTKGISHPAAQRIDLAVGIVLPRNQQCGDLEPDIGVPFEVDQRIQHAIERATADRAVETLGKRLQINICGVHMSEEFSARFGRDIAGGHRSVARPAAWQALAVSIAYSRKITGSL